VLLVTERILVVFAKEARVLWQKCRDSENIARHHESGELSGLSESLIGFDIFITKIRKDSLVSVSTDKMPKL